MVGRLAEIKAKHEANPHGYLSSNLAEKIRGSFRPEMNIPEWFRVSITLAKVLIQGNQNQEAIEIIESIKQRISGLPPEAYAQIEADLDKHLGLAWLRFGEQENCVFNHSEDACLFPIKGKGVHIHPQGSENALKIFKKLLDRNPNDLRSLWLYNVAATTLGLYPNSIDEKYRIDPSLLESDYPLPRFYDVAAKAGVDIMGLSGGGIMADFNHNGFLDIMASSWTLDDETKLLLNKGDGTFHDASHEAGLKGIVGGLNMTYADYDNDGDLDVLILRGAWLNKWGYQPNSLLQNNGEGSFRDVTKEAGLLSFHPTQTATWFDYDGDGWIDLFIGNETTEGDTHASELYHNNGDGTFSEVAQQSGIAVKAFVKGCASGDYDNDGRPDLFLSVLRGKNYLFRNAGPGENGGWRFEDATEKTGVSEPIASFPCWFWDYDNDGWEDLFVSGYQIDSVGDVAAAYLGKPNGLETPRIYRNNRQGGFDDVSATAGLELCWMPMGANFGDLDNDGWLDFYVGTGDPPMETVLPNQMYRNDRGKTFQDVTTSGNFGHLQKGHAVSFGDYDNDGDQDVHIVMGGAYQGDRFMNALFENPGSSYRFLKLHLEGRKSNRAALGARIHVLVKTPDGERSIYRTKSSGGSFGCNPSRLEIGLGDATEILSLEVFWPSSNTKQTFENLELDKGYRIVEGNDQTVAVEYPQIVKKIGSGHSHEHSH